MWLLVFFLTPIVEMYLLIEVGGTIGAWPTIFLVMLTAVIGVALLRRQGLTTLTRGVGRLQRGELPAREMVEGLLLAVAGALLLTPGFLTDGIGFVLLAPLSRGLLAERVLASVTVVNATTSAQFRSADAGPGAPSAVRKEPSAARKEPDGVNRTDSQIIDGEFTALDEAPKGSPKSE